jgi:uncharacterized protein (TIGR02598 family)
MPSILKSSKKNFSHATPHLLRGFSLVEVTIALGIASFCLLSVLGLLLTGLSSEKTTVGQTVASNLLSLVYSDLVSASNSDTVTKNFGISLTTTSATTPQTLYFSESGKPTGTIGTAPTSGSRYRVTIGIQAPSDATTPTQVRLLVTWPASADSNPSKWPTSQSSSVEVVTTLDRS